MSDQEKVHHGSAHVRKRDIILRNFLGGIAWGVGSVVGATVVVAILVSILRLFNFVPVLGDFITQIVEYVELRRFPIR